MIDQAEKDEISVQITPENVHKYAAMLRFKIENELGHSIPDDAVVAVIKDGEAFINVKDAML